MVAIFANKILLHLYKPQVEDKLEHLEIDLNYENSVEFSYLASITRH